MAKITKPKPKFPDVRLLKGRVKATKGKLKTYIRVDEIPHYTDLDWKCATETEDGIKVTKSGKVAKVTAPKIETEE